MKKISLILFIFLVTAQVIWAQNTYTVNTLDDAGSGSLRQILIDIKNNNDTDARINFSVSGTINLSSRLNVEIEGIQINGNGSIVISGSNSSFSGINILADNVTIENLTLSNFTNGIVLNANKSWIKNNTIFNNTTGIYVKKSDHLIQGNNIYNTSISASAVGIRIRDHAKNTQIGGDLYDSNKRNIIHGFDVGIYISESSASTRSDNTFIQGNIIGRAPKLPEESCGVENPIGGANNRGIIVDDYAFKTVIGPSISQTDLLDFEQNPDRYANIFMGNIDRAINIATKYEGELEIYGNYFGVDPCGQFIGGQSIGVASEIIGKGVKIGSDYHPYLGNIFAKNGHAGITMSGSNSEIEGNLFGTDRNNKTGISNGFSPLSSSSASLSLGTASRNCIVKNNSFVASSATGAKGLRIRGGSHIVELNQFGFVKLEPEIILLPNYMSIEVWLGGASIIRQNEFLGASHSAIAVVGSNSIKIQTNCFGATFDGRMVSKNTYGVHIRGTRHDSPSNLKIGGRTNESENLFEGNYFVKNDEHIRCLDGTGMRIQGNQLGIDLEGRVHSNPIGIVLDKETSNVLIGGDRSKGYGNVVVGISSMPAIHMIDKVKNVQIQGNIIGLDPTGTKKTKFIDDHLYDYKNNSHGVVANYSTSNITVGGLETENSHLGNIIGNNGFGVILYSNSGTNGIYGNYIGTDISGSLNLGNRAGATYLKFAQNLSIGNATEGMGNVMAFNEIAVFRIREGVNKVSYAGNEIYGTPELFEDLSGGYNGGNTDAPVIGDLRRTAGGELTISVNSASGHLIDVYAVDPEAPKDIREYIGRFNCPSGTCSDVVFDKASSLYSHYRFTSTTSNNQTSKFSAVVHAPVELYASAEAGAESCGIEEVAITNQPGFDAQKGQVEQAILELTLKQSNGENPYELFLDFSGSEEAWSYKRTLEVAAFNDNGEKLKSYEALFDFEISESRPSQQHFIDYSDILDEIHHFQIGCSSPRINIADNASHLIDEETLLSNIGFEIDEKYKERRSVQNQSGAPIIVSGLKATKVSNKVGDFSLVRLSWEVPSGVKFEEYDLQIMMVEPFMVGGEFNHIHNEIIPEFDWSKAALIEVLDHDLTDNVVSYEMTLAEGTGLYVWRIRPIGDYYLGGRSNNENYGEWCVKNSFDDPNGDVIIYDGSHRGGGSYFRYVDNETYTVYDDYKINLQGTVNGPAFHFQQFDEDINFIYSKILTEGGRQSEMITYANGLSMVEQVQTKLESKNQVIATQTVSDYAGRPALKSLPAPVNDSELNYKENFFNVGHSGEQYNAFNFDFGWANLGGSIYSPEGLKDDELGSPNYYYSDDNTNTTLYDKANLIPDAKGFPYVRTVYSNDPSGRVIQQSAPGQTMKLDDPIGGNTRNTINAYTSVDQQELDMMFGTEAPLAKDVYKTITTDPNKVTSVAYITKAGQTIATCLDDNKDLDNLVDDNVDKNVISGYVRGGEIDEQSYSSSDSKTFQVTNETPVDYTFSYKIKPQVWGITEGGCDDIFCRTCDYRLDIVFNDLNDPASPFNATLSLELDQSNLDCESISDGEPLDLKRFKVVEIKECESCFKVLSDIGFSVGSDVANDEFTISFPYGRYSVEKRLYVNNSVTGKDDLYLEDQIAQMRAGFDNWKPDVLSDDGTMVLEENDCFDFRADEDPESSCAANIYCESDGSFGSKDSDSYVNLKDLLSSIVTREADIDNNYFLNGYGNKYNQYFEDDEDNTELFLDQLIVYNSVQSSPRTCTDLSESLIYTDNFSQAMNDLIDGGAVASQSYLRDQTPTAEIKTSTKQEFDDQFDVFQEIMDGFGYEGRGLNASYYCFQGLVEDDQHDVNVLKSQLVSQNLIATRKYDNPNINWREGGKVSGCTQGQGVHMQGYIEVPKWAKDAGSYLEFRIRRLGQNNVAVTLDGVASQYYSCEEGCDETYNRNISNLDFLTFELFAYDNVQLSNDVLIEWKRGANWETIPPFYYHPTCSVKNDIHVYNAHVPLPSTIDQNENVFYLAVPSQGEYPNNPSDPESLYTASATNEEIIGAELMNTFFTINLDRDIEANFDVKAEFLKDLDIDEQFKPTYEETVHQVCEAYYESANAVEITWEQKNLFDLESEVNLRNRCKQRCAESKEVFNQAIETFIKEENAELGVYSNSEEIDELGNPIPNNWMTSFDNYDDDDRDCYIESIRNQCLNTCDQATETEIIDLITSFPVFSPKGADGTCPLGFEDIKGNHFSQSVNLLENGAFNRSSIRGDIPGWVLGGQAFAYSRIQATSCDQIPIGSFSYAPLFGGSINNISSTNLVRDYVCVNNPPKGVYELNMKTYLDRHRQQIGESVSEIFIVSMPNLMTKNDLDQIQNIYVSGEGQLLKILVNESHKWNTVNEFITIPNNSKALCFYSMPVEEYPETGETLIDDVSLTVLGVSNHHAKIKTFFEQEVFPKVYDHLNYIINNIEKPTLEERRIYLHNEPGELVQYVEMDYGYSILPNSSGRTTVSNINFKMYSDCRERDRSRCSGGVKIKEIGFFYDSPAAGIHAGIGLLNTEVGPIQNIIQFKISDFGALEYHYPERELYGSTSGLFKDYGDFPRVKYLNGKKKFSSNENEAFWAGVFTPDCHPDYGTCEACLQWKPLKEHFNDLTVDYPDESSFNVVPFDFCQEAKKYAADQAEIFIQRKMDEKEALARESFQENCLGKVEDELKYSYSLGYYHFTKYYYDRAGNLIETVPPQDNKIVTDVAYIQGERADANGDLKTMMDDKDPAHQLNTTYQYNSIGQLMSQETPDGGVTRFWYNAAGQLVLSQDAQQATKGVGKSHDGDFTYTMYDYLGRIVEVGEIQGYTHAFMQHDPDGDGIDEDNEMIDENLWLVPNFPNNTDPSKSEVTITRYSTPASVTYQGKPQEHLRNRVSYVIRNEGTEQNPVYFSTYYSYDPHGNVEWMIQDIPGLGQKTIAYDYDLVSGNVNEVIYMEDTEEQFIHRYSYDEDNRITSVETSTDGLYWTKEANYDYYLHGPLARTEIGQDKIQGCDYVYTIEGYLKSMNEASLTAFNDPGKDGLNNTFLKDEFGMELGYYDGDYDRSGVQVGKKGNLDPWGDDNVLGSKDYSLYNGNIAYWMANTRSGNGVGGVAGAHMRAFRYDELNRLRTSDYIDQKINPAPDEAPWGNTSRLGLDQSSLITASKYDEVFTYDRNGNLSTTDRSGVSELVDQLNYFYKNDDGGTSSGFASSTNQLSHITDAEGVVVDGDLGSQNTGNYKYDAEGNLTDDLSEHTKIYWNVLNKVEHVELSRPGAESDLYFRYDASGNRVVKESVKGGITKKTYYVRDASGNIMGIYSYHDDGGGNTSLTLDELPIYGSDRIGEYRPDWSQEVFEDVEGNVQQIEQIKAENHNLLSTRAISNGKREIVSVYPNGTSTPDVHTLKLADELPEPRNISFAENEFGERELMFYQSQVPQVFIPKVGPESAPFTNLFGKYSNKQVGGELKTEAKVLVKKELLEGSFIYELQNGLTYPTNSFDQPTIGQGELISNVYFAESKDYYFSANFNLDVIAENELIEVYLDNERMLFNNNSLHQRVKYVSSGLHQLRIVLNEYFLGFNIKEDNVLGERVPLANLNYYDYSNSTRPYAGCLTDGSGEQNLDASYQINTDRDESAFLKIPSSDDYYLIHQHDSKLYYTRVNPVSGIVNNELNLPLMFNGAHIASTGILNINTVTDHIIDQSFAFISTAQSGDPYTSFYSMLISSNGVIDVKYLGRNGDYSNDVERVEISPDLSKIICFDEDGGLTENNGWIIFDLVDQEVQATQTFVPFPFSVSKSNTSLSSTGNFLYKISGSKVVRFDLRTSPLQEETVYNIPNSNGKWIYRGRDKQHYFKAGNDIFRLETTVSGEDPIVSNIPTPIVLEELAGIDFPAQNNINITSSGIGREIVHQASARQVNNRSYEMKDHLGNVRVVLSDARKGDWQGYMADPAVHSGPYSSPKVRSWRDYYAFGWEMRKDAIVDGQNHRYGFNGKEQDTEWGGGSTYDYGFRIYDSRIGKFLSVDPLAKSFPWNSSYAYAENDVIRSVDLDGMEKVITVYSPYVKKAVRDYIKKRNYKGAMGAIQYAINTSYWQDVNGNPSTWYQDLKSDVSTLKIPTKASAKIDWLSNQRYNPDGELYSRTLGNQEYLVIEFFNPDGVGRHEKFEIIGVIPLGMLEEEGVVKEVSENELRAIEPKYINDEKEHKYAFITGTLVYEGYKKNVLKMFKIPKLGDLADNVTEEGRVLAEQNFIKNEVLSRMRTISGNSQTSFETKLVSNKKTYKVEAVRYKNDKGMMNSSVKFTEVVK